MSGKQFLYIIIVTFTTVAIWVTLDIIHSRSQVDVAPQVKNLLEKVDPNLDQTVINELGS